MDSILIFICIGLVIGSICFVLNKYPEFCIWIIPLSVTIPRSWPRILNLGFLEIGLSITSVYVLFNLLVRRKPVRIDQCFIIMLLISLILLISAILKRGDFDTIRFYGWGAATLGYFLALNSLSGSKRIETVLIGFVTIVIVMVTADLLLSDTPLPTTDAEWAAYRSYGAGFGSITDQECGQANFLVSLPSMFIPFVLTYLTFNNNVKSKLFFGSLLVSNTILAILVQTRAYWLTVSATVTVIIIMSYQYGKIKKTITLIISVSILPLISIMLIPEGVTRSIRRFQDTHEIEQGRVSFWMDNIVAGLGSPIIGHGSIEPIKRMSLYGVYGGHGLFPEIFFSYGIILVVLVALLIFWWLRTALNNCLKEIYVGNMTAIPIAIGHLACGICIVCNSIINDFLIFNTQYAVLAFATLGFLSASIYPPNKKQK